MRWDLGDALLPWERLLWSGRPWQLARRLRGERYLLTDFRIVCASRRGVAEIALDDAEDVHRTEARLERLAGTSTLAVHSRAGSEPQSLPSAPSGAHLAA